MKKRTLAKTVISNVLYPVAALAAVIAVWAIVAAAEDMPLLFPSLGEIFRSFGELLGDGKSWLVAVSTLGRVLAAFALSTAFAIVLSAAGAFFPPLHRFLRPVVTVLQSTPTMAVIYLAIAWLTNAEVPLLVGFLICFPLMYNTCRTAIDGVDGELLEMAKVYKMRPVDRLTGIYIPAAFPIVADGARSAVSLCVKVIIAAEVLAQTKQSIGLEMNKLGSLFEVADLMGWTVVAIVLSFLLEGLVALVKKLWEVRR